MKHVAALLALAAAAVLGVAACGGGGGPAPTHTAQSGEPTLLAVPGYDYGDLPSEAASATAMVKSDTQHFKSASVHAVLHEGNKIAEIILFQMQPQFANSPGTQHAVDNMAAGMAGGGATVSEETIHTEKVAIASKDSTTMYAWYHANTLTVVGGDNASAVRDFVEAYLKTANG